jgi:hypothetical protein
MKIIGLNGTGGYIVDMALDEVNGLLNLEAEGRYYHDFHNPPVGKELPIANALKAAAAYSRVKACGFTLQVAVQEMNELINNPVPPEGEPQ